MRAMCDDTRAELQDAAIGLFQNKLPVNNQSQNSQDLIVGMLIEKQFKKKRTCKMSTLV